MFKLLLPKILMKLHVIHLTDQRGGCTTPLSQPQNMHRNVGVPWKKVTEHFIVNLGVKCYMMY